MSVASSIPHIKIPNPSSSCSSSSSPSTTCSSSCFRLSTTTLKPCTVTIRSYSQAEGPIRRPVAPSPSLREPSPLSPPLKPVPPSPPSSPATPPPPKPASAAQLALENVITLEFQRQKAKELQDYFKQKKLEEANQGPFFGFLASNEIANGRWAMFGFAVGMLTEYATGSDFVDQVKIILSNFGIVDLE
ncbi:light-harvesting complex-like protein OHP2, chloroplastic [Mercurialis annua]|uniref:light-harvesting complex-like protein OHP2, chloroplastic n=1 Tax=Mercurialis annua TaxID=3986 RepID=UPI0021607D32|nr:light-harvesting complex-like protein OHP2, chloroplastic [Mercurialis annua]